MAAQKPPTIAVFDKFWYKIVAVLKQRLYFFGIYCLHIDPTNDFYQNKFTARSFRSEGERLKDKFWPLEIKKIWKGLQVDQFLGEMQQRNRWSNKESC